jgi:hypothetical protein
MAHNHWNFTALSGRATIVASLLATALTGPASAHRADTIDMNLNKSRDSGPADLSPIVRRGDAAIEVSMDNADGLFDLVVRFPLCQSEALASGHDAPDLRALIDGEVEIDTLEATDPTPGWSVCLRKAKGAAGIYVIRKGEQVRVKLDVDFREFGAHHVVIRAESFVFNGEEGLGTPLTDVLVSGKPSPMDLESILAGRSSDAEVSLSLYYLVGTDAADRPTYERMESWDALFGSLEGLQEWEGPMADAHSPASDPVNVDEYLRQDRRMVPEGLEYDPEHNDLAAIDTTSFQIDDGGLDCVEPGQSQCWHPDCAAMAMAQAVAPTERRGTGTTWTLHGTWSVRWTDGNKRPGWGWKVVAWTNEFVGFLRGTEKLGEATVDGNGRWSITFNSTEYTGADVWFGFFADNDYFRITDRHGNPRRWLTQHYSGIGTDFDAGDPWGDGHKGIPGVGEMYFRGYELWSETYWRGGFNVASGSKATVYFPNDFFDCGRSDKKPWSCANQAGTEVWVIADHGTSRDVMQHELGHQMQGTFWGRQPSGCCLSHSLGTCYNEGLGLSEGYANFVTYWVQSPNRATIPPDVFGSGSGADMESPNPRDFCKTPGEDNEWWVASTFWDLYDSRADGKDILWFNHPGAVHKIALSHGPEPLNTGIGMPDMLPHYRAAASGGHEVHIENIFKQANTH